MQSFFYHIALMKLSETGGCQNEFESLAGTHHIQHRVLDVFLGSLRVGISVSKWPNLVRHLRISHSTSLHNRRHTRLRWLYTHNINQNRKRKNQTKHKTHLSHNQFGWFKRSAANNTNPWLTLDTRVHPLFTFRKNRHSVPQPPRRRSLGHRSWMRSRKPPPLTRLTQKRNFPRRFKRSAQSAAAHWNRRFKALWRAHGHGHLAAHPQKGNFWQTASRHNHQQDKLRSALEG